ncbi:MAG: outer membrane lipoprotein-sorting protein [Magnetococcales bacterium]|nr:outer membrane lipoprotein-sorting protein [Magnetococcales bacterium]
MLRQVDAKLFPASCELYLNIVNKRPGAAEETTVVYLVRRNGEQMASLVVAPEELKGQAILRLGEKLWIRRPSQVDADPIPPSHSLLGGVINNSDLLPWDLHREYRAEVQEENDARVTLTLHPRQPDNPYKKLLMLVDARLMIPTEIQYFSASGQFLKTMFVTERRKFWEQPPRPTTMRFVSALNPGYETTLSVGVMKLREFPESAFTIRNLGRIGLLMLDE